MCATGPPSEWQLRPNAELSKEFYSDVEVRGDLGEHDTLLSIEKA
jgi:UDP-glucose 4-epimerase